MSDNFFTPAELSAIRRHYKETVPPAQRLTDGELDTALLVAEKRKLYPPPLGQHIFFMKRKNREQAEDGSWRDAYVLSLQTGIDGFRLIAERTNKYVGSGVPEYENDPQGFVKRAIIHVEKIGPDGQRAKVGADAWFEEYAQYTFKKGGDKQLTKMWSEKGRLMLSKCAEALALRKAFPELSGLYTTDEMGAEPDAAPEAPEAPPTRPSAPAAATTTRATSAAPQAATPPAAPSAPQPTPSAPSRPPEAPPATTTATPAAAAAAPPPPSPSTSATAAPTVAASAAPPASASTTGGSPALAPVERKKKIANALAMSCSTFGVTRPEMVRLVRSWAPRPEGQPQVIGDAGNLNAELLASECDAIVEKFKAWEFERRNVVAKKAEAEKAAEEWEQGQEEPAATGGASDEDIPF